MEAQSEYVHIAYTFLHVWHRFVCSVGDYLTKCLHRSSVGPLLRVHCWLGLLLLCGSPGPRTNSIQNYFLSSSSSAFPYALVREKRGGKKVACGELGGKGEKEKTCGNGKKGGKR